MPPRRSKRRLEGEEGGGEDATAAAAVAASRPSAGAGKKAKAKKKGKKEKSKPAASSDTDEAMSALPNQEGVSDNTLLSMLLLEVQALSQDKGRCTAALQAMLEGRVAYTIQRGEDEGPPSDFHPTLASYAAALAGKAGEEAAVASPAGGKKRGAEKKSAEKKGKGGADGSSNSEGSRDAHVVMAATHAINVLLRSLKKGGDGAAASGKTTGEDEEDAPSIDQSTKDRAIMLIALSHPLITALVNDRTTLETITKASRGSAVGGSPRHSRSPSSFSMDLDDEPMTRGRSLSPERGGSAANRGDAGAGTKRVITSHAKAAVGRALASGVMGALWGMEALVKCVGCLKEELEDGEDQDKKPSATDGIDAEHTIVRKCLWSALVALEAAFQLTPQPKLLSTSAVSSPTGFGADTIGGGVDFDRLLSGASAITGGSVSMSNSRAHQTYGADVISTWNALLQRILLDYQVALHEPLSAGAEGEEEKENSILARVCQDVNDSAFQNDGDSMLISLALREDKDTMASEPPAKKKRRTATKRKPASKAKSDQGGADHSELSMLLSHHEENSVPFDCHVSVRRWAALAFGWLGQGQKRLLQTGADMLSKGKVNRWAKVMELPEAAATATEVPVAASTKKKKKSKKKSKSKSPATSDDADLTGAEKETNSMPGNLAVVVYVSCMADAVHSSGATGGLSPPSTGWMDEYVKAVVGDVSEAPEEKKEAKKKASAKPAAASPPTRKSTRKRSKTAKGSSANDAATTTSQASSPPRGSPGAMARTVWVRPEVRNEASVLARLLVEAHCRCMQENYSRSEGPTLIFDDGTMARHYPFIARTLDTLGRTVASSSSSFGSSSGKLQTLAMGSAVALGCFSQRAAVFDAKLLSLAVTQLLDCVAAITSSANTSSMGMGTAASTNGSPSLASLPSGVLVTQQLNDPFSEGEGPENARISMFVRAQISSALRDNASASGGKSGVHSAAMTSFLQCLVGIVRSCYNSLESPPTGDSNEASPTTSKKKGSKKKKKRKANELASTLEGGLLVQNQPRKTLMQSVLASDSLDALAKLVAGEHQWNAQSSTALDAVSSASLRIRSFFPSCLSKETCLGFVPLGQVLEANLIQPRHASVVREFSAATGAGTMGPARLKAMLGVSKAFDPWERQMFKSHIQLALTIGQLQPTIRGEVFQSIVAAESERRRDQKSKASAGLWPLCLPGLQHALVSSLTMSQGSPPSSEDLVLLCDAFLNSMDDYMTDLSKLPQSTLGSSVTVEDDILISLRDCRLFAVAVSKLGRADQVKMLSRLVRILHDGLQKADNKAILEAVPEAGACHASCFVARGVTLCAAVADVVVVPGLIPLLRTELASTDYSISGLRQTAPKELYPKEEFQGLCGNGQSPSVPLFANTVAIGPALEERDHAALSALLRSALEAGLRTSSQDGCHLLFSAWNAIAKLSSWTSHTWDGPTMSSTAKKLSHVDRLACLREDMCSMNDLVGRRAGRLPHSLLTKILQSKPPSCRPYDAMMSGVNLAKEMLTFLTTEIRAAASSTPPSLDAFAYYEALPLYASFMLSVHTRPGANDIGASHRLALPRQSQPSSLRGQTHGNPYARAGTAQNPYGGAYRDYEDSEFDTEGAGASVMRLNSLTRLHEACASIGAAPCFPDWLDTACRLREDISPAIAVDSAAHLLNALTRFGVEAFKQYFGAMERALNSDNAATALRLLFAQQHMCVSTRECFHDQVSLACQIGEDGAMLCIMVASVSEGDCLEGASLLNNSAQRIRGADNHKATWKVFPGEHRANDQWETLFSETLRGSSLTVSSEAGDIEGEKEEGRFQEALVTANHWRRVLYSVVNAMVPAAALLRFGMYGGRGRNTHSLCNNGSLPGDVSSNPETSALVYSARREVDVALNSALSFLSCISAHSPSDEDMRLACRAAAGHLLENASSFSDLTSLWAIKISCEAMDGAFSMLSDKDLDDSRRSAVHSVIETTLLQFVHEDSRNDDDSYDEDTGLPNIALDSSFDAEKRTAFLASLGVRNLKTGKLIGKRTDIELESVLLLCDVEPIVRKSPPIVELMVSLLCSKSAQVPTRTRAFVSKMLLDLVDDEFGKLGGKSAADKCQIALSAALALDDLGKEDIASLVKNDIFDASDSDPDDGSLSLQLIRLFGYLASVKGSSGDGCKLILSEVVECVKRLDGSRPPPKHAIKLLGLLASRFGSLDDAGKTIMTMLQTKGKAKATAEQGCIDMATDFFQFVATLDRLVNKGTSTLEAERAEVPTTVHRRTSHRSNSHVTLKNGDEISRTCSFVETGEGFTEQHWYNCYTCGLLWDKGCCSLCARVCHKGHDIGYSRKSSFFCDCGAEVATAIEQNRTVCKCLSPVSEDIIRELYEKEMEDNEAGETKQPNDGTCAVTELIATNFAQECQAGLKKLVKEANASQWRETLLKLFDQRYSAVPSLDEKNLSSLLGDAASQPTADSNPDLQLRSAKPLTLNHLYESSLLPIRAAKASALQSRAVSSASTTSNLRKSRDLEVRAIAADQRGRLFIAESSSILFCNAVPSVNVRSISDSSSTHQHLTRSQLNILGSDNVKFSVSRMTVNNENNRHLLVWGNTKACVVVLSKSLDSFERTIDLNLNLDMDSEYLVKCDWMPQSELHVVAVCGTVVHVFDLKRTETDNSCSATTHYALAYEDVLIRSATLIGPLCVDDHVIETRLALILDTGRLYFLNLTVDEEGNLEDHGESYIEVGSGVSFPTGGIRRYNGSDPIHSGATSTSFGDGLFLAYLRKSNLLLYQCSSSCCIAMLLDDDGGICGSFELLPNVVAAEDIGSHYGVAGPYAHFQELGTVTRAGTTFYRVTCVGKSSRSSQPKALILEFNEHMVKIRELPWPSNCSSGLGFISSYSFVGSATFSLPYFVGGTSLQGSINDETQTVERAYLTLMSSSGSLLWFAEDCDSYTPHIAGTVSKPLMFFEKVMNVTSTCDFGGDFVSKDPNAAKRKLSLNNTDYVMSPSRDGGTLTATLQSQGDDALAIVAVRVLVGSMPEMIPRELAIMGRSVKLKKNVKRWYDFPLTDEETLLAMRNGFVTLWISSCDDPSSTPIIDSVEVYAQPRSELSFLQVLGEGTTKEGGLPKLLSQHNEEPPTSEILISCVRSLTCLTQTIGQNMSSSSGGAIETIGKVLQQTSLDSDEKGTLRDQAIAFLSEAEGDAAKRALLIDDNTLRGLMSALRSLDAFLRSEFNDVDVTSQTQETKLNCAIEMLVRILSSTITIAQTRGGNYKKVITDMIAEKACEASMALEGKKVLDYLQYLKALHGANIKLDQPARMVSELVLMEIACSDSKEFAQFETLAEYLVVDSNEIVKACCSAISNAIGDAEGNTASPSNPILDKELAYVTYQCDACLAFPIKERRYTFGGDDNDIDLCKKCYDEGISYARQNDQLASVIINGRTLSLENDETLTCQKIWQMTSKPIAASSLEQAEKAKKQGTLNPARDAAMKLNSSGSANQSTGAPSSKRSDGIEVVKTEGFRSQIFTQLLGLMTKTLDAQSDETTSLPSVHVLQLVIALVLDSHTEGLKAARGKEMAVAFTSTLPGLLKASSLSRLVAVLRSLSTLLLKKHEINRSPPLIEVPEEGKDGANTHKHHHHKDKTDPRFICDVHGVPAVRRRCSQGVHKDRRFYVCGLERKLRCNYFKWSSDVPDSGGHDANEKSQGDDQMIGRDDATDIFLTVRDDLQQIFGDLEAQFCGLVSSQFEGSQTDSALPDNDGVQEGVNSKFPSLKSEAERTQDVDDGVDKSLERLGMSKPMPGMDDDNYESSSSVADGSRDSFLSSTLDLFSLLAPKRKADGDGSDQGSWSSDWFSVLCEMISNSTSSAVRNLAKLMLQRLCGDYATYHRIRDHYIFGFQVGDLFAVRFIVLFPTMLTLPLPICQFRKLLQRSQDILDSALVVREQARQCGPDWREDEVTFDTLPASGLLGVEELISEDWYAISTEDSISAVLNELVPTAGRFVGAGAKASSENSWRQFCGLPEMVSSNTGSATTGLPEAMMEMLEQIYRRPPIVSLLWLGCCLRGSNQVKVFSLVDFALEDVSAAGTGAALDRGDKDAMSVDADHTPSDPELRLIKSFVVDDLVAFIKQFVLNGRSKDLRSITSSVARKLALRLSSQDQDRLFTCLIDGPFRELATWGHASKDFSDLLRLLVERSELDLSGNASCIAASFISQMTNMNHHQTQNLEIFDKHETDSGGLCCDLSDCVYCHKQNLAPKKPSKSGKKSDASGSASSKESDTPTQIFLPEQVRTYQKCRLEASVSATVSTAFSSYNQLKFRVALSEVQVNVTDPRGRLVKTIGVYFSPRQVGDESILKSDKYAHLWQKCGTLTLARGASQAICKLKAPVIAANLKFTYEEFYEKSSNRRAADGSFILYCPRCTRQVHNAHGVCGNCGEVAFQCRKCRHINYDQLDAFLCVECGYCTAGGFTFDLTCGIALNATAIVTEDDFSRSMSMLRLATKRQMDLRNSLKKKLMVALQQQRRHQGALSENLDELVLYGPQLKRALLGGMPKSEGVDEDDDKKSSGSSRAKGSSSGLGDRASSSTTRARSSLLSLARSLRSEGGDTSASRGDILRQALLGTSGSGPSGIDALDDDLLNALASSAATSSGSDPLSRIVASISARTHDQGRSTRTGESAAATSSRKEEKTKLSPAEERQRLHTQMREAERECYELNRRLDAWNRLNKDCLAGGSASAAHATQSFAFTPSTCSVCGPPLAHQMLSLLHTICVENISQAEHTVTSELVKILLTEPAYLSPKLKDLKRRVLITLATTSEAASNIILTELKLRLVAVQDVTSAEILGQLVQLDFPSVNDYIELAKQVVEML
ncbi:hypothetical protein ACHAXT_000628 [Thalassiosira profunda]